jgi:hypothetical protein
MPIAANGFDINSHMKSFHYNLKARKEISVGVERCREMKIGLEAIIPKYDGFSATVLSE